MWSDSKPCYKENLNSAPKIFEANGDLNLNEGATEPKYSLPTYYIDSSPLQTSNQTKEEAFLFLGVNIHFSIYYFLPHSIKHTIKIKRCKKMLSIIKRRDNQ